MPASAVALPDMMFTKALTPLSGKVSYKKVIWLSPEIIVGYPS
jgi:hypothetical protein